MRLPKGILYLLMAALVGVLAVIAVDQYTSASIKAHIKPNGAVVIATADIPAGTTLNSKVIKTASWPRDLIPSQAAGSAAELEGRAVKTEISKGEPIMLTKLAPRGSAAGLSGLVSPGKRAFTIRVDDVSGVAGFVNPGDPVDVLVDLLIPSSQEHFSKTILQNIRVLTAGQFWEQRGDLKPTAVSTVTLVLTPEEGELLNLACGQGKIRLVLRSQDSTDTTVTQGVTTSQLINGGAKAMPPAAAPTPPPEPKSRRTVDVIKRLARSAATF
jgi:pilus assembly protein CpaB